MNDPSDLFSRTRYLYGELSAAILGAASYNLGIARGIQDRDFRLLEQNCDKVGKLLAQALEMQMTLARQIRNEPRADVVDMRGVNVGERR